MPDHDDHDYSNEPLPFDEIVATYRENPSLSANLSIGLRALFVLLFPVTAAVGLPGAAATIVNLAETNPIVGLALALAVVAGFLGSLLVLFFGVYRPLRWSILYYQQDGLRFPLKRLRYHMDQYQPDHPAADGIAWGMFAFFFVLIAISGPLLPFRVEYMFLIPGAVTVLGAAVHLYAASYRLPEGVDTSAISQSDAASPAAEESTWPDPSAATREPVTRPAAVPSTRWHRAAVGATLGWMVLFTVSPLLPEHLVGALVFVFWGLLPLALYQDSKLVRERTNWPHYRWAYIVGGLLFVFGAISGAIYLWRRYKLTNSDGS